MTAGFAFGDDEWPGIAKLIEEMGEVGQVVGRLMALHGQLATLGGIDVKRDLVKELADLQAAIDFVMGERTREERGVFTERRSTKLALFQKWHHDNRRQGP